MKKKNIALCIEDVQKLTVLAKATEDLVLPAILSVAEH